MAKKIEKGDVVPYPLEVPDANQAQSTVSMSPAKRAFYVDQITEALAVSILRDVQSFARVRTVPNAINPKRVNWEKVRSMMLDSFIRLFQLDKESSNGDGWATKPAVVIDVPSNVQAISNAEDKTKQGDRPRRTLR